MSKIEIEAKANVVLVRGWILDGAGPARFGYGRVAPCKQVWVGRTLAEVAATLGVQS